MTREYAVNIMGVCVCEGRVDFVAEKLEMSRGTIINYATKAPAGIEVVRLSGLYSIPGSKTPLTEEQACDVLLCDADDFKRSSYRKAHGINRVWREQWSLPIDDIRGLRVACDERKFASGGRKRREKKSSSAPDSVEKLYEALDHANNRINRLEVELLRLQTIREPDTVSARLPKLAKR